MANKKVKYDRTAFIGPLNGQYKVAKNSLPAAVGRANRTIILGNIIGVGVNTSDITNTDKPNESILTTMNFILATHPSVEILVGQNELIALKYPSHFTTDKSIDILTEWWFSSDSKMTIASVDKDRLVTHGGLCYGTWVALGKPKTARAAAELINEAYGKNMHHGACYNLGYAPSYSASPVWANPLMEVYPSWVTAGESCPFDQVHSSLALDSFVGRKKMSDELDPLYFLDAKSTFPSFGSVAMIKSAEFKAVDLGLNDDRIFTSMPAPKNFFIEKVRVGN